ncbi:energy-coupling factor ABC transporter permease [Dendrosporobacter sp. 1207_IL3150]|uniref:energy-coupling factor ABC transporter permease n=1 Tax=Dendrosporobacter sp. 1207_IL3150 TaxID=3084054 RepID=UPI002FD8AB46
MHMADALISPVVGGAMWAATAGLASFASKKVQTNIDSHKVPLMGVLGAFVFAAQMINFTIPGTGSSGHLGGGILLAILLGPHAAFLTIASILAVQALFFADGGLLALGCNIFNMGFLPCYIAYPFIFKPLTDQKPSRRRIIIGSVAAAVAGLQLGAFGVVMQTLFSGISELPFLSFLLLMQPIHLAIGIVEGIITAVVISFIYQTAPEILTKTALNKPLDNIPIKPVLVAFFIAALVIGSTLSWFASSNPDGLEWSITETSGQEALQATTEIHGFFADLQEKLAFLPDYNFKSSSAVEAPAAAIEESKESAWPAVDRGTSTAGIVGSLITLLLAYLSGKALQYAGKS